MSNGLVKRSKSGKRPSFGTVPLNLTRYQHEQIAALTGAKIDSLRAWTEAVSKVQVEYKPWKYMTEAEINEIKKKNCCSCAYSIGPSDRRKYDHVGALTCNYISDVGHRRPCRPEECREKGVWRKKK